MPLRSVVNPQELERLRAALAAAGDLAYDIDLSTNGIIWSGPEREVFGSAGAARAQTVAALEALIHPDDQQPLQQIKARHLADGTSFECEYRLRQDDGEFCWVQDRGCARLSATGEPVGISGVLRIITARKHSEAQLEEQASYDELTGHYNRVRLRDSLEHALVYAQRYQTPGAYITIGIDNLTMINDAYGYATADAVIVGIGQRLDRHLRASDVVGRMDGDRFSVVLSQCSKPDVVAVAEKILDSVREAPIETPSGPIEVTVSAGGVNFQAGDGQAAHDVIRRADIALQEAKQVGRNCFVPYHNSEEHQRGRRHDIAVAKKVQDALRNHKLVFAFQPIVRADDGSIGYYESLVRMIDEDGGLVAAGVFVPVVERMGLVRPLDRRVLAMAVEELHRDPEVSLAINVSGLTASDRAWLRLLIALVKGKPEIARRLIIEITETVALHDIDETARFVATVRDLGCRVALDDFGAGYTSFRHLQALAVDMVKIDGSFVRNLANDRDNQLFVKTLLSLAEGFGLETVAECVETAEDVDFLADQGVGYLQGYYIGKPDVERHVLPTAVTLGKRLAGRKAGSFDTAVSAA